MHDKSVDELLEVDIDQLKPKEKEIMSLALLRQILNTLRYIERNIRPVNRVASVIELEAKIKPQTGE